jgi:hypothetical protein
VGQTIAGAAVGAAFAYLWILLESELVSTSGVENDHALIASISAYYRDEAGPPVLLRIFILGFAMIVVYYQRSRRKSD